MTGGSSSFDERDVPQGPWWERKSEPWFIRSEEEEWTPSSLPGVYGPCRVGDEGR